MPFGSFRNPEFRPNKEILLCLIFLYLFESNTEDSTVRLRTTLLFAYLVILLHGALLHVTCICNEII